MDIKLLLRPLVMRQHQFSVLFLVIIIDRCLHLQSVPAQSQFLTDGFLSLLLRSSPRQETIPHNPEAIRRSGEHSWENTSFQSLGEAKYLPPLTTS